MFSAAREHFFCGTDYHVSKVRIARDCKRSFLIEAVQKTGIEKRVFKLFGSIEKGNNDCLHKFDWKIIITPIMNTVNGACNDFNKVYIGFSCGFGRVFIRLEYEGWVVCSVCNAPHPPAWYPPNLMRNPTSSCLYAQN